MKVNKQVFKYVMRVGPHLSYRLPGVWYPRIPFCENISFESSEWTTSKEYSVYRRIEQIVR